MDSVVRLRQLNQPEVSGFVVNIILQYLKTGTISGIASNTGNLNALFYPLNSNPSGYVINSLISGLASQTFVVNGDNAVITSVAANYYPLHSNPSGYITSGSTGLYLSKNDTGILTGQFYPYNANPKAYLLGNGVENAVDFKLKDGTNNRDVINFATDFNFILQSSFGDAYIKFNENGQTQQGSISGFYIDARGITIQNIPVLTGFNSGAFVSTGQTGNFYPNSNPNNFVTFTQLTNTSGLLKTLDSQNFAFSLANMVVVTGLNQQVLGIKQFGNDLRVGTISGSPIHEIKTNGEVRFDNSKFILTTGGDLILSGASGITSLYNNGGASFSSGRLIILPDGRISGDGSLLTNITGVNVNTLSNFVYTTGTQLISGIKTFHDTVNFGNRIGAQYIGYYNTGAGILFSIPAVDLQQTILWDLGGVASINWTNNLLKANDNSNSLNWFNRQLINTNNSTTLDWGQRLLIGTNGLINWDTCELKDSSSITALDYNKRLLTGTWSCATNLLVPGLGVDNQIDIINYHLNDSQPFPSIDWNNYLLLSNQTLRLDWNNQLLFGSWNADALSVSGNRVLTTLDSGAFQTGQIPTGAIVSIITGQLSSTFYPRVGNPSGFINTGQTGSFGNINGNNYISNIDPSNQFRVVSGVWQLWDIGYYGWMGVNFLSGQMVTTGPTYDYITFINSSANYRFISGQFQLWDNIYSAWISPIFSGAQLVSSNYTLDQNETNANFVPNITAGSDYRFFNGYFQLWDTLNTGWISIGSFNGQLFGDNLLFDAGETDNSFVRVVSRTNSYRFFNNQFQLWDAGYNSWVVWMSYSGQYATSPVS